MNPCPDVEENDSECQLIDKANGFVAKNNSTLSLHSKIYDLTYDSGAPEEEKKEKKKEEPEEKKEEEEKAEEKGELEESPSKKNARCKKKFLDGSDEEDCDDNVSLKTKWRTAGDDHGGSKRFGSRFKR